MELSKVDLNEVEFEARRVYTLASRSGLTYAEMSEATGLPASTFSMWLRGYRPITKVRQLQALARHAHEVDALAMR